MVEALIRGSKITLIYNLFNFYFKPIQLDPSQVFTNSELRLTDIEVIGFDYDYTLSKHEDNICKFNKNIVLGLNKEFSE